MKLPIIYYPDPILRIKCAPVEEITPEILQFISDLEETMLSFNAIGFASPQVGKSLAICLSRTIDTDEAGSAVLGPTQVFINPKLSNPSKETWTHREANPCIADVEAPICRPESITVTALDTTGTSFTKILHRWCARVLMHENDHLNGVLFIDRLDKKQKKYFNIK